MECKKVLDTGDLQIKELKNEKILLLFSRTALSRLVHVRSLRYKHERRLAVRSCARSYGCRRGGKCIVKFQSSLAEKRNCS
jgi:hypothetical protein